MSSNVKILAQKLKDEDLTFKGSRILGPNIETKLDELKLEMVQKIEKELNDSQNARVFISQKYDELCNKISFLTDLDATVTGFRSDVKTIEKQISELSTRVDDIERKAILKDNSSLSSSLMQGRDKRGCWPKTYRRPSEARPDRSEAGNLQFGHNFSPRTHAGTRSPGGFFE